MIAAMRRTSALGIEPDPEPRATEYVGQMIDLIGTLERKGLLTARRDVNFAVRKFPGYGKLSGKSLDELRAGERVAVLDGKEDPLDFVLWKAAKPSEPADAQWASAYGPGRPGWHIECSAMSCALLGEYFDIHGGGMDCSFRTTRTRSRRARARRQAVRQVLAHNGFLNVDNEKMSKSVGNFFTIRDVLKRYDGESLRFFMLRTHYRSPFNFSDVNLDDARTALRRLYTALDGVEAAKTEVDWAQPQAAAFRAAMNEDFNTPLALAVLFDLASDALAGCQCCSWCRAYLQCGNVVDESAIEALIAARTAPGKSRLHRGRPDS
jgi:cysteinyl-tRNA synthetase